MRVEHLGAWTPSIRINLLFEDSVTLIDQIQERFKERLYLLGERACPG